MQLSRKTILWTVITLILILLMTGCTWGSPPPCSQEWLVDAINDANGNGPGTDIIVLDGSCVYQLGTVDNTVDGNNGLPSITTSIVINGNGATIRRSTGSQKAAIRLLHISQGGELTVNDLILYDGLGMNPPDVTPETLNSGGAIFNAGVATVNNSTLDYNRAKLKGGGIYNTGTLTVNNSTLKNNGVNIDNVPGESGGAIYNTGTATITASTISGNIASQSGAGIANAFGGTMTIVNSTISANSTTLAGIASGAAITNGGTLDISYTTITSNNGTTSGAVFSAPDTISISNSIISSNLPQNCSYPAASPITGPNLDDDSSCDSFTINADPQLGPLASNGGPTLTHAIAPSSPAKNAAAGSCPAADQRGEPRPHGSACDLGAYELSGGGGVQQSPAELSGIVYNDLNGDGIMDPGEPPFAGVELVYGDDTCMTAGISQTTLSGSDGSYQFTLLSPNAGTHCISIDPLMEPNTSILIPGGFTDPVSGEREITITEGQILGGLDFGWMFQFGSSNTGPNLEITDVVLSATTIPVNNFVEVEVTVTNQGDDTATGYDVVLIPHYGSGPPNPAGFEAIPDLAPGDSHTIIFTPGVLYANLGTHTLRVLVTDDWYDLGDPDSTGTAGDFEDREILVVAYLCSLLEDLEITPVLLRIPPETRNLPLYLKVSGDSFPGIDPEQLAGEPLIPYQAQLGDVEAYKCGPQGFPDRLYCMFNIPEGMGGTEQSFQLLLPDCQEPVYELPAIQIPVVEAAEPSGPVCSDELNQNKCEAAGGDFRQINDKTSTCICP